jgi:hypothetical protein
MRLRSAIIFSFLLLLPGFILAQKMQYQATGNGNPIIPGYFADPTVKKFGDTYYIYATTDGNGGGLGPSQVWTSKDFVNWTFQDMNWPTTHNYWAPDVAYGNDGKYYLYYCQPTVEVYGASSSTPVGPWTPLFSDGKAVVPNYLVPKVITLDGQTFRDDNGRFYMTWGTWGIYPGFGCGVGLLNPDMRSFSKTGQIPNTLAKDFFEGSFMFKRKGIYYLMYSSGFCEDGTYRVQYAQSKTSPMEGFSFGKNNPILSTNADGTIHGPGHNSVLQIGDDYYIIYHRHNNPHSGGGYNRQVCADKLIFDADGNIEKVIPTHTGIGFLGTNSIPYPDLAYQKKVTASSYYSDDYKPSFAVDANNGTLWKPKTNSTTPQWLQVDLGKVTHVKNVLTQFEYATWYYQYYIEYSTDGKHWSLFADKRNNLWHGSPYVDKGDVKTRYIKLTITNTEYPGLYKAVWNFKIYGEGNAPLTPANIRTPAAVKKYTQKGLLINLDASTFQPGTMIGNWNNTGILGGSFKAAGKAPFVDIIAGKKAVVFTGQQSLRSSFNVPPSLAGNNSYTVSFWAYTLQLKDENPLLCWAAGSDQLTGATFGYGTNRDAGAAQHIGFADIQYNRTPVAGKWHHIAITFDGTFEKVYVDGELNNQENKMLFVKPAENFSLGSKSNGETYFSGAITSLQVYDRPLADTSIQNLFTQVKQPEVAVYLDASKLPYGELQNWKNEGYIGGGLKSVKGGLVVADVAGKISATIKGNQALKLDQPLGLKNNYSIAISVFTTITQQHKMIAGFMGASEDESLYTNSAITRGKWHYLVKTVNGSNAKEYIDGQLISSSNTTLSTTIDTLQISAESGFSGAIAGISIYKHALTADEVKDLNNIWVKNLHVPMDTALFYKQNPKALTPGIISMQAGHSVIDTASNLQYNFTCLFNGTIKESGWMDNPYYIDYGLEADKEYSYTFKVRDNLGNVTPNSPVAMASTATSKFVVYADKFANEKDYLNSGTIASIWDGFIGKGDKQTASKIHAANDTLTLSSEGSSWDGNAPYGPFIYKNVKGDFIAEVEVSNVSGLAQKKVLGNNDVGLMIRAVNSLTTTEQLLQNSIFPAWNVGNLSTNFVDGNRQQLNTQSGWNYNKYLQIQRDGNLFYLRTSNDQINWIDLPGSPILRNDLDQKDVQVGLYQCTYGPIKGFGSFSNFSLVLSK